MKSLKRKLQRLHKAGVFKIKKFTFVNDCFKNENNAVFGVFLQRLIKFWK